MSAMVLTAQLTLMTRAGVFLAMLLAQAMCAAFFSSDLLMSALGISTAPISWTMRELMELGALVGLFLGMFFGGMSVWRAFHDLSRAEQQLHRASSAFVDLMRTRFDEWNLTSAERDVALLAIKGLNVQEIAQLRNTSEGTVKSQTAQIYRKAEVTGRPQLLSLFIEDLLGVERAAPEVSSVNTPISPLFLRAERK